VIRGSTAAGPGHSASPRPATGGVALQTGTLTISPVSADSANGIGTVTVTRPGAPVATCPPDCTFEYNDGDSVTLTANPSNGSFFYRWKDNNQDLETFKCAASNFETSCTLTLTGTTPDVGAVFLPDPTLAIGVTGNNAAVTVSPPGDECATSQKGGEACYYAVKPGDTVTLTPKDVSDSTFVGWSVPECPGTDACRIVIDSQLRSVVATYKPMHLELHVRGGDVNGTVSGGPIKNCANDCEADFPDAFEEVTLTASSTGFKGWNGACQEETSETCTIRLSGDDVVGAWFDEASPPDVIPPRIPVQVQVKKTGDGQGSVSSARSRLKETIGCGSGSGCDALFQQGETARLVADPAAGSMFAGWKTPGGLCTGDVTCRFEVTRVSKLEANFKRTQPPPDKTLALTKAGGGSGTVTSSPAGISCGSTCAHAFRHGTAVTLTAAASGRSRFAGWSGGCSGTGSCTLTMSANRSVTATFNVLCVVPNVKGKRLRAGKQAIRTAHCSVGKVTRAFSARVKKGRVISQKPKPGTKLAAGSNVKLKVSKGKKT
jgi:hypothetical protein